MWNSKARDIERAIEVDLNDLVPLVRIHLVDRSRGTSNARVVHEDIQTSERIDAEGNHPLDVLASGHIADSRRYTGDLVCQTIETSGINVAHKDPGALRGKRAHNLPSNT